MVVYFVRWLELTLNNLINPPARILIHRAVGESVWSYIFVRWLELTLSNLINPTARILIHRASGESVWPYFLLDG